MERLLKILSLVLSCGLAFSGCLEVENRVIEGKTWQIWGDDLRDFRTMTLAAPTAPADRCAYWQARRVEVAAPLREAVPLGTVHRSDRLRRFVEDEQARACATRAERD